jgi:regulator of protease activity HflC (stomatin/prohibitin superfamily)
MNLDINAVLDRDVIIKDTHRGLLYEDGVLTRTLEAGRYELPKQPGLVARLLGKRATRVEVVLVDVRQRELTIKGQEILTADKVAVRVSIIVQYRVVDARAAVTEVESYEERLYSDVQLAARRSLASMTLEAILTQRNQLSTDILSEVKETAAAYGVAIGRADVKDLVFPGNLQEIMNKVLAAERTSQAALVEARTRAQTQQIDAQAKAEMQRLQAETDANTARQVAQAQADARRLATAAEVESLRQLESAAASITPGMLRLRELDGLRDVARNANARIYIGVEKANVSDA